MNMPNPNSIAIKVMKSTGAETSTPSQFAKFPTISSDHRSTKLASLHPKVKMEEEAKQQKVTAPIEVEPKAILIPKENGEFEIQVTCSCGEVHQIQCETFLPSPPPVVKE